MMAQRFPEAFDGIVAGNPALLQNYLATIAQGYLEKVNRDVDGKIILPVDKLPLLNEAVMAACDAKDGRTDGVIDDPASCSFDPEVLTCAEGQEVTQCLSRAQISVVNAFYDGAPDENGEPLFAGLARGSELGWGVFNFSIGTDDRMSGSGQYATQVLKYLAFETDPDPSFSLADFDHQDPENRVKLEYMARIYNADDPDLSAFQAAGGKLIVYHGLADPLITPFETINYYEKSAGMSGGIGATQDFFRLFMLPGVYHCRGGPGSDQVDWLTAIRSWVENDVAPDQITARKLEEAQVTQERILYPYPKLPDLE
jgi:feruloyl esterase